MAWKQKYPDKRGRHDRQYRTNRKTVLENRIADINPLVSCDNCMAIDRADVLFTHLGTCRVCGLESQESIWLAAPAPKDCKIMLDYDVGLSSNHRALVTLNVYNPGFYLKEGLNNWRCICPIIPNEHFKIIITEILNSIGKYKKFDIAEISRTVVYNAVSRVFGASPWTTIDRHGKEKKNRRFLVYHERWLFIKKWFCEQSSYFEIENSQEWLRRYHLTEPNEFLIEKLEYMMKIIHQSYVDLKLKGKQNRPRRDVCILFLLHGIHPALTVFYGTDFWKPPTTMQSRLKNEFLFKTLLVRAKEIDPSCPWPSDSLSIDEIENFTETIIDFNEITLELSFILPFLPDDPHINRKDYELY